MNILLNLVFGAVGGNILGKVIKSQNLGFVWNTILGLIGGFILKGVSENLMGGTLGSILGAAIAGALMLFVINLLKKLFSSKKE